MRKLIYHRQLIAKLKDRHGQSQGQRECEWHGVVASRLEVDEAQKKRRRRWEKGKAQANRRGGHVVLYNGGMMLKIGKMEWG